LTACFETVCGSGPPAFVETVFEAPVFEPLEMPAVFPRGVLEGAVTFPAILGTALGAGSVAAKAVQPAGRASTTMAARVRKDPV
jgi:hypothetical protein